MKKILFFGGLLLSAMTFVACSEDYDDWASPQSNPQEDAVTLPGYAATGVSAIDLANVEGETVKVLDLSSVTLPEGATVGNTRVILTPADDASASSTTINVDESGCISVSELQTTIESYYGKRPTARTFNGQVYSNIITNGQTFLVDAGTISITATPVAPFISSGYYLVGDMCGWDQASALAFSHSDADVYEDPVFTITFSANANNYWKIIPQSNIDNGDFWHEGADGVVGVAQDGDKSLSGTLVAQVGVGAGCIENAGFYRMTINMMDYTYSIEAVAATYYLVGDLQGWSDSNMSCAMYPSSTTVQSYTTQWNGAGNFKIWDAANFGDWGVAYGAQTDGDNSESGALVNSNSGAIVVPTIGEYYTYTADFATMTYTWTRLENQTPAEYASIGLVGDFSGWADGADILMEQVAPHNWYVSTTIPSDGGLKFRVDGGWDVNWGDGIDISAQNYGTGVLNGGNITVPAGAYSIYFNDITGQFLFVAE